MSETVLRGVIAAIATPIDEAGAPDVARFARLARRLLDEGCDGLAILGTTGEATSFSTAQRLALMRAVAESGLPMQRLLVGTGAAAIDDAVTLGRAAGQLGFAAMLLLPPFYYKGVSEEGIYRYVAQVVSATATAPVPICLYNFPALSGVSYDLALIERLLASFPERIQGLKDSSGDVDYARAAAALSGRFSVLPGNEAVLFAAERGAFPGCISATANISAPFCARGFHDGDDEAARAAVAIRKLLEGRPPIPGIKSVIAHVEGDDGFARTLPPLVAWPADARAELIAGYESLRGAVAAG